MNVLALLALVMALITSPAKQSVRWASDTQIDAFRYGPYPQCASGGWGAGKTWDYCMKALWLSTEFPQNRGVIARSVAKELRATTMATFYKVCNPALYDKSRGGRRNDQDGYLKLAESQSEILFMHFEDPNVQGIIKGLEINWFLIDQAEEDPEHMEEIFDLLLGRLGRWDIATVPQAYIDAKHAEGQEWEFIHPDSGRAVPPPYAMLACNPDVEVHWIYRRFHEESHEHQTLYKQQGYKMFHMPSLENRFLGDTNKRFLLAHDDAFIRRNVAGLWGLPEGAIHAIDKLSLVDGSPELLEHIRATCRLYRIMDHGDSAPTCVLWMAVDRNGNIIWYREYYQPNALVSTHRANVADLSEYEHYEIDLADPSIFHKEPQKQGGRWSVADEWADINEDPSVNHPRRTAVFWGPADNNELGTRNRINEYLRVDPERVHPFTKAMGSPRMFFIKAGDNYPNGCYHVLRESRSQRRVKIGTDLGKAIYSDERDPDITDHSYDCLRYGTASRATIPAAERPSAEGTFFSAQRKLARFTRRQMGGRG